MPKIFIFEGYKFFFFSNEGNPREPVHVHVRKAEKTAKFWIKPDIALDNSYGFNSQELKMLENLIKERSNLIEDKWNEYFNH